MEPGQASLHHGWTIHSSSPNYSHERRIGLNIQYISPSMKQTKSNKDTALLIRGVNRFGYYAEDQAASEVESDDFNTKLLEATEKYHSIAGTKNHS